MKTLWEVPHVIASRIMSHILAEIDTGCWIWQKRRCTHGYGTAHSNGKSVGAHRFVYEAFYGPIPEGFHIDHLCRRRDCVNPSHLEAVTCQENILRGDSSASRNARKTHCKRGHPFDEENTYIDALGGRQCRRCHALKHRLLKGGGRLRNPGLPYRRRKAVTPPEEIGVLPMAEAAD